jgi:enoyl-[acyl-carrier protein] reductase II
MSSTPLLDKLWQQGCNFLQTRYAILGGAMTWVSNWQLVSAISNAGCFGVLAAGAMPTAMLREEIRQTRAHTDKKFGVNLITIVPHFNELLDATIEEKAEYVILAGTIPKADTIKKLKDAGIKVMAFGAVLNLAKSMLHIGVDALIIEGNEAGGHVGPICTSVLAQEILPEIQTIPVFIAGGIGRGSMLAAYLTMGAAGCQLGTRFVVAEESPAHLETKKAYLRAKSRNAQVTAQFDPSLPVFPVRAISNEGTKEFYALQLELVNQIKAGQLEMIEGQKKLEEFWLGGLRRAIQEGDVRGGSLMAGQSVGLTNQIQPVQAIVDELVSEAEASLNKLLRTLSA